MELQIKIKVGFQGFLFRLIPKNLSFILSALLFRNSCPYNGTGEMIYLSVVVYRLRFCNKINVLLTFESFAVSIGY